MKSLVPSNCSRCAAFFCGALLLSILTIDCRAQSRWRKPASDFVPRVGTIKDYPATGLMTGCGNLYFYQAAQAKSTDASYVFLSRGDGSNAWMNLGGRDVRLRQIKPLSRQKRKPHRHYYRLGRLRITVLFEDFKPEDAPAEEGDSMFKMTIILRNGHATRIVRAVGDSDC
jgi:hypothetical protein